MDNRVSPRLFAVSDSVGDHNLHRRRSRLSNDSAGTIPFKPCNLANGGDHLGDLSESGIEFCPAVTLFRAASTLFAALAVLHRVRARVVYDGRSHSPPLSAPRSDAVPGHLPDIAQLP